MAVLRGLLDSMRNSRWLAVAVAAALGLTLAAGSLVTVFADGPSLTLTPAKGTRDDPNNVYNQRVIHVSGDLWADPGPTGVEGPYVFWDDLSDEIDEPSALIAPDGTFAFDESIPLYDGSGDPVRPGKHTLIVCANYTAFCDYQVSATFSIPAPKLLLSETSGRPNDTVTISGTGWSPGNVDEELLATWDPSGANIDLIAEYFEASYWSGAFSLPAVPPGTYKIRVCDVQGAGGCAAADTVITSFTVLPPVVTLSKSSGISGDSVKVSGSGFFQNDSLFLFFGPRGAKPSSPQWHEILPATSKTSDPSGNFGPFTFTASGDPGDYDVLACSTEVGLLPSDVCWDVETERAPYTILAPATPTPTPTPTASPSPSPTPTASPTPTPTPSATATPSPSPTAAPTATPSLVPTAAPTLAPTAAPHPTTAPTATPGPSPTPTALSWPEHLNAPGSTSGGLDAGALAGISLLALLIAFLMPFPGTLFNKTVESNYDEIRGWIAGARRRWNSLLDSFFIGPLAGVKHGLARLQAGRAGVFVFIGLSALVYGFLSPTFGLDMNSLALFLGLVVGLLAITAAFDLPLRLYHGRRSRRHDRGVLRALWWTLAVAVLCVVISRLAGFQPGYLYGLIVSIVFVTEVSTREEGIGTWLASLWLLLLAFGAWILLALVRQGAFDPWLSLFLETVLVTFVVAGIETLAVGLLPLRFLPGHPLYSWRRAMWFPLFALAIFGYLLILVDPANGYLSNDSRTPMLIGVIFLVVFGTVSIGTWAYFRFRPSRVGEDRPGEAPSQ